MDVANTAGRDGRPRVDVANTAGRDGRTRVDVDGTAGLSGRTRVDVANTAGRDGRTRVDVDGTAGRDGRTRVDVDGTAGRDGRTRVDVVMQENVVLVDSGDDARTVDQLMSRIYDGPIILDGFYCRHYLSRDGSHVSEPEKLQFHSFDVAHQQRHVKAM